VVQPTYVWANAGHYPLLVPIDGGDVGTLAEALIQRIQWPKDRILIPPMTRHPNPEATTCSKGTTVDAKRAPGAKHTASRTKLASHAQRVKDVPVNFS
jgi:hypothetical protein